MADLKQRIFEIQLETRKCRQLIRHKHPLTLEYEVNGQKIVPSEWIRFYIEEDKHTLILNEDHKYDGDKFPSCYLCDELILGPSYSCSLNLVNDEYCSSCGYYYLHKSCAQEATPTMHHPIHPHHPLTFFSSGSSWQICDSCGALSNGFIYSCQDCNFNLDMKCAFSLLEHKIVNTTSGIHEHPLILFRREALLLCDGCGKKHEVIFYICITCMESDGASSFVIHRNCALLPRTIRHRDHPPHLLNLSYSYSLPTQYSQFENNCKICSEWINPKYWIYYCGGCRYFVHIHCATLLLTTTKTSKEDGESSKQEEEETSKTDPCNCETVIRLPPSDESVSVISHFIKHMTLKDKKAERITELDHDNHNHPLILHDVQSKYNSCSSSKSSLSSVEMNDEICNFCTKPIMNASFYNCAPCSFSLHEFCAALPTEVRYPVHPQHSLILRAKATTSLDWSCCHYCQLRCFNFRFTSRGCKCKDCSPISDDFAFYCASCKFFVHIKCALSPGAITHESHPQHLLILKEEIGCIKAHKSGHCKACGYRAIPGTAFECKTCSSFKLHILCAYLP